MCVNPYPSLFTDLMGNQLCGIPYFFCFTSNYIISCVNNPIIDLFSTLKEAL